MVRNFVFVLIILLVSCTHKEIKEQVVSMPEPSKIEKTDYSADMIAVYEKLVRSIKKRDFENIKSCYLDDAVFTYGQSDFRQLRCFDGTFGIKGSDNIINQYKYLFKSRLLDSIEFEIIKINKDNYTMKIINLWANSDFGVYEHLDFSIDSGKVLIASHTIRRDD